jgi:linoleoyl-CoA desaturase
MAADLTQRVKFPHAGKSGFSKTLNARVNEYFKENKVKKVGDYRMVIKSIVIVGIYAVPFTLMLTGIIVTHWPFCFLG